MIIIKSDSTERKTYKRLENLSQKERSHECACVKQGERPTESCDMYSRKKERKSDENKWRKFKYSLTNDFSKSSNILFMLFLICIRSIKERQEKIQWNIPLFMMVGKSRRKKCRGCLMKKRYLFVIDKKGRKDLVIYL